VISLVTPAVDAGPFNIVVPPVCFTDHVSPVDPVRIDGDWLAIGDLCFDLRPAADWFPCPPWESIRTNLDRQRAAAPLLCAALQNLSPPESLAGLVVSLPETPSAVEGAVLRTARTAIDQLATGLRLGDENLCLAGVTGLTGLGLGLTPAGDDWLVGCALAGWAGLLPAGAEAMLRRCLSTAADLTGPLSAAWLRAAADGLCHVRWHRLFEAIRVGDRGSITAAARDLIRQGHTSGADALAGYVAVMQGLLPLSD